MSLTQPDYNLDRFGDIAREDARISSYLRHVKLVLVLLMVGVGGWAMIANIDGAVIAPAKVAVEANSKSVQHSEGGIVTSIAVRDGQTVARDQVLLTLDAADLNEKMKALRSQASARKEQLTLLKSELDDLLALEAKRLVPRSQVNGVRRQVSEMEGDYARLTAELATASTSKSRLEIKSPISGRVHKLGVHTVGGVVAAGQELAQIVPSDAALVLEARVNPNDIDQVRQGQPAHIRLSSFNQRTTPELAGQVLSVSADLVSDERKEQFHYLVQLKLDDGEIERLGGKSLVPGMPADVFIRTDRRSVMSYLMKPLTDQFARAFREE